MPPLNRQRRDAMADAAIELLGCQGIHGLSHRAVDVRLRDAPTDLVSGEVNSQGVSLLIPFGDGYHRAIIWDRQRDNVSVDARDAGGHARRSTPDRRHRLRHARPALEVAVPQ